MNQRKKKLAKRFKRVQIEADAFGGGGVQGGALSSGGKNLVGLERKTIGVPSNKALELEGGGQREIDQVIMVCKKDASQDPLVAAK